MFLLLLGGCAPAQPALRLLTTAGQPFDWWAAPARFTVVVFSRADCPIANQCAPELIGLWARYEPQGIAFFIVNVDPDLSPSTWHQHLRDFGYPCPGLCDPHHDLVRWCGATRTPEAFVWTPQRQQVYRGRVNDAYVAVGQPRAAATTHDLADALAALVADQPVPTPVTVPIGCRIEANR